MKAMKYFLLLVVCMTMAACGGENLDNYKEKTIELLAKKNRTTPELFISDYNVIIDSMSVTPITVADSIEILKIWQSEQSEIEKDIEKTRKKLRSFFNFSEESDRKELKRLEAELKEIQESDKIIEKYSSMKSDEVLGKFFLCRISAMIPLLGRQTEFDGFVFDKEGVWLKKEADKKMLNYFKTKNKK